MSQPLEPGDIVYFWSKYNSKTAPSKKRLSLRRWHGPALLVALEGHNAGYVSFKGQLSKCAREHLRSASSMEQISAEVWHDAIQDCVEAALHDVKRQSSEDVGPNLPPPPTPSVAVDPSPLPTVPEQHAVQDDLPPVAPNRVVSSPGWRRTVCFRRRESLWERASRQWQFEQKSIFHGSFQSLSLATNESCCTWHACAPVDHRCQSSIAGHSTVEFPLVSFVGCC